MRHTILALGIIMISIHASAKEFEVPHEFKSGDIVSADVFNEIFLKIKNAKNMPSPSDLIGTWECASYVKGNATNTISGWQNLTSAALFKVLTGATLTFRDDGDGTFSLTTSAPNPLNPADNQARTATFEIVGGVFAYEQEVVPEASTPVFATKYFDIHPISESRFSLKNLAGIDTGIPMFLNCDERISTPEKATRLSITASGDKATLTWTNNSSNETGFKILRKTKARDTYTTIATTDANATTYTDEVDEGGTYWYRVVATNTSGDAVGSNVAKFLYAP